MVRRTPWLLLGFGVKALAADEAVLSPAVVAPEGEQAAAPAEEAYVVTVFGHGDRAVLDVPGSATVLTAEDLEAMRPLSANEALATAPGVHVVDEDGMGLRPNVGIRGLDPNRSRTMLVLEDGVPVALAPYGEPEMYWAPLVDRMDRVEIVKGSGSIRFGPQTIGGVVNYVTPDPTEDLSARIELRGGTYGYFQGQATVSDTLGPVGVHVSALHQRFPGPRALGLVRTDAGGKLVFRLGEANTIAWKVGLTDEHSHATYLGLTTPQYETDPRFNFAENDELTVRRTATSLVHVAEVAPTVRLRTSAYFHRIQRDWWRQDFDRSPGTLSGGEGGGLDRVIDGKGRDVTDDPAAWADDGSSIFFRDSTALRGRTFTVGGVEPTLSASFRTGAVTHGIDAGVRVHAEHAHEVFVEADEADARRGELTDLEDRYGVAAAAWILDRLDFADGAVQVSPGIRLESLWTTQRIARVDDVHLDEPLVAKERYLAPLPGLGVAVHPTADTTLFAGVHRGWAPPRTKDGVTTDGELLRLDAEHSWNTEVGARAYAGDWLFAEATGFWLAFQNQIVPPSEAGGATSGAVVNGGDTTHLGVEATVHVDPTAALGSEVGVPLTVSYTFVHATFGEGWNDDIAGRRMPYAPAHQLTATAGVDLPFGLDAQVKGHFVSAQTTDKEGTVDPSVDGLVGRIDSTLLLDAQVGYTHVPSGVYAFVACKNLLDTPWIASRAPRGIQPGMPRHVFAGLGWRM